MMEKEVQVRAREQDQKLVESIIPEAAEEFTNIIKKETGVEFKTKVTFDANNPLKENICQ